MRGSVEVGQVSGRHVDNGTHAFRQGYPQKIEFSAVLIGFLSTFSEGVEFPASECLSVVGGGGGSGSGSGGCAVRSGSKLARDFFGTAGTTGRSRPDHFGEFCSWSVEGASMFDVQLFKFFQDFVQRHERCRRRCGGVVGSAVQPLLFVLN